MKIIRNLLLLQFAALGLNALAQGNDTALSHVIVSLKDYTLKYPVEKVYLQLDKPYYAAGDDIWFKAYATAGSKHELSAISGVLNVELTDSRDSVEQAIKLPLVSGLTWGDFKLPDTLNSGYYRIRAYTRWMRNAGPDYFYDKLVYIANTDAGSPSPVIPAQAISDTTGTAANNRVQTKIDLQFFPEGGDLVYGINSVVAFKATGAGGLGKNVTGLIVDDQGKQIAAFTSAHLGMGEFNLLPVSGCRYHAVLTYPDSTGQSIPLPLPMTEGYVMHIDNSDSLKVKVIIEAAQADAGSELNLVAQEDGDVYYAASGKSAGQAFIASIPKNKFPSGIVQFTLFSGSGEPLNERLVFIRHPDHLSLDIKAKGDFTARGKMKLELEAKNAEGKAAPGNFSVAVTDESKVPVDEAAENTIFSDLLLTSDLRGYIEQPGYYFTKVTENTRRDLDILMMTQGYRRFEWKQVLTDSIPPAAFRPQTALDITGFTKTPGGKPAPHVKVSILNSQHGLFLRDTLSDEYGRFVFRNLQFGDSTKFIVQAAKKSVRVVLDDAGPAPVTPAKELPAERKNDTAKLAVFLSANKKAHGELPPPPISKHTHALKGVKVTAPKILPNSSNLNGPGNADQVLLEKDLNKNAGDIASSLIGKLRDIFFKWDPNKMVLFPCMYRDGKIAIPKIMVDGVEMDAETLNTLPPGIVESVEVLRSGAFTSIYGEDAYNGLILINTKKGGYGALQETPNILTFTPRGYYKAREFYSPQYKSPQNQKLPGVRTTIYWNPNLVTGKDGKTSFEFYNADVKGTYRVVIEGINGDGQIGRTVYEYKAE